jgi:hypothetical protein
MLNNEETTPILEISVDLRETELKLINAAMKAFNQTDITAYVKNAVLRFAADELSIAQNILSQEEQFENF